MYERGLGVPQDYAEAMKLYRKGAEQEDADSQFNIGAMYANGWGVPQDFLEAVKWYRKAAEQGDEGALIRLGNMYSQGQGVPKSYAEALKWIVRQPIKEVPQASTISDICTLLAKVSRRTTFWRTCGSTLRLPGSLHP